MSIDNRQLRDALGRFATGVCVITTSTADGRVLGVTANSFSSVSLEPPIILWSLQNGSDVYEAFARPRYFAVNVLGNDQLDLCLQYARKGDHLVAPGHYRQGKYGSPIIRGALVSFECELHDCHEGGDHLIVLGHVRDMQHRPTGKPLLFYSGDFHEIH